MLHCSHVIVVIEDGDSLEISMIKQSWPWNPVVKDYVFKMIDLSLAD